MSDLRIYSDRDILDYLLGALPETETEQIEEKSICDEEFFERIEMAEGDLIRDYLAGALPSTDRVLFSRKYFATPALRRRVEFAEQLRLEARDQPLPQRIGTGGTRWLVWPRVAVPALAGAAFLAISVALLKPVVHRHPANPASTSASARAATPTPDGVVSLLLLPGVEKGGEARDHRLVIPQGTSEVHLELQAPAGDAPARADIDLVRVAAREDEKLLTRTVEGRRVDPGRLFVLVLPPTALPEGSYIAYLRQWPAAAHPEPDETFVFSVGR